MTAMDQAALFIGYAVILAGAVATTAFVLCLPIGYAWRRFGDVASLLRVIREAKRQGRPIFKDKESKHENQ